MNNKSVINVKWIIFINIIYKHVFITFKFIYNEDRKKIDMK